MKVAIALACAALAAPVFTAGADCQGLTYIVKPGTIGLVDQSDETKFDFAVRDHDQATLDAMLTDGSAVRVPDRAVACVRGEQDLAPFQYRKRIVYEGAKVPVWVAEAALTPVQ